MRFLNIDIDDVRKKLGVIGARRVHEMMLYRRFVFHLQNPSEKGYARVREEDSLITMTIKKYVAGTKYASEYEVKLGGETTLEAAKEFMVSAGFVEKAYHETLREKYMIGKKVEVVIDIVPGLPPYIEIEAPDEAKMLKICKKMGFDIRDGRYGAYGKLFDEYYGISQTIADDKVAELKFKTIDKVLKPYVQKNQSLLGEIKKHNLKFYLSVVR